MVHSGPMDKAEFGRTAEDYAVHRAGFPPSLFDRLGPLGIGGPGQKIVDIGTGTGTLARGFAARGADVTGIDMDLAMLVQARLLAKRESLSIEFTEGTAETTGLANDCCDVVSAGQCWHWFNPKRAIAEILRILRPDGLLLICHFDWLALEGNMVEMTERLVLQYCPEWRGAGGMGLYPLWLKQLGDAGWRDLETFSYDMVQPYSAQAWRGRIQASAGIASLLPEARQKFDQALEDKLSDIGDGENFLVPHRVFALIAQRP